MKRSWWDRPMGDRGWQSYIDGRQMLTPRELLNAVLAYIAVMAALFVVIVVVLG